jgi:hypothetical protein
MSGIVETWSDEQTIGGAKPFWLYCITESGCEGSGPCKIGVATEIWKRLSSLQGGNWRPLMLAWVIRVSDRRQVCDTEARLLIDFRPPEYGPTLDEQLKSEWVSAAPGAVLTKALTYLEITHAPLRRVLP